MKSKERKEPREKKKTEPKPRKSSEKGKHLPVQAASDPEVTSPAASPGWSIEQTNGAGDGSAALASVASGVEAGPSEDMIRVRAYELFLERGGEHGRQLEDWFAAERELRLKYYSA